MNDAEREQLVGEIAARLTPRPLEQRAQFDTWSADSSFSPQF